MKSESQQVSKYWSQHEPIRDAAGFYTSPIVRPLIIEMAYGEQFVAEQAGNPYYAEDLFIGHYLTSHKVKSILSLCCGFGSVERRFVTKLGTVEQCLGLDIAVDALNIARERALQDGLRCMSYECVDVSQYQWTPNTYDLVIANGALHHIRDLEPVLEGIRSTLKPGGLLYACEYVGPCHQDHSPRRLELINACAYLVPPELRARRGLPVMNEHAFRLLSKMYSGAARRDAEAWPRWKKLAAVVLRNTLGRRRNRFSFGAVHISPKKYLLATDPSEGVRSTDIIPLVKYHFPNVEIRPFGGGILQFALDDNFYAFFDASAPTHAATLKLLRDIERHLMDTGELGAENAFLIGRKN